MRAVFYRSLGLCELPREIPWSLAEMLRYVRQFVANSICHLVKVADRVFVGWKQPPVATGNKADKMRCESEPKQSNLI